MNTFITSVSCGLAPPVTETEPFPLPPDAAVTCNGRLTVRNTRGFSWPATGRATATNANKVIFIAGNDVQVGGEVSGDGTPIPQRGSPGPASGHQLARRQPAF